MKVKTLVNAFWFGTDGIDEVELYGDNEQLISKMCVETLVASYGDAKVKKFNIYVGEYGITTLELVLFGTCNK